jgi:hypothetical protein
VHSESKQSAAAAVGRGAAARSAAAAKRKPKRVVLRQFMADAESAAGPIEQDIFEATPVKRAAPVRLTGLMPIVAPRAAAAPPANPIASVPTATDNATASPMDVSVSADDFAFSDDDDDGGSSNSGAPAVKSTAVAAKRRRPSAPSAEFASPQPKAPKRARAGASKAPDCSSPTPALTGMRDRSSVRPVSRLRNDRLIVCVCLFLLVCLCRRRRSRTR